MIYRGNSVAYIYAKKDAYRSNIDNVNEALTNAGMMFDGKTSNVELINRLHKKSQGLEDENKRLSEALEKFKAEISTLKQRLNSVEEENIRLGVEASKLQMENRELLKGESESKCRICGLPFHGLNYSKKCTCGT